MNTSIDFRRGRSCVFMLHVHLVFVTKYRRKVFTKEIMTHLEKIFSHVCQRFQSELVQCDGENDHVHLLINYPPTCPVSRLVNSLKGVSSRLIRKADYPSVKQALWGKNLWSPSYFAGSCGGASLEVIKQYIESQQTPG
jgi:putative transposase